MVLNTKKNAKGRSCKHANFQDYVNHSIFKDTESDCWFYSPREGHPIKTCYPLGYWRGEYLPMRVVIYKQYVGQPKPGKRIHAKCGFKACINPDHFYLKDYSTRDSINPEMDTPTKKMIASINKHVSGEYAGCWGMSKQRMTKTPLITLKDEHTLPGKRYTSYKAAIIAYEHFIGPIPKNRWVKPKCGHRGCINPEHLYLCEQKYNPLTPSGRNPTPTKEEMKHIIELRDTGLSFTDIAKVYLYSYHTMSLLYNYLTKS